MLRSTNPEPEAAWRRFEAWCKAHGERPVPPDWTTVVYFVRDQVAMGSARDELEQVVRALGDAYRDRGLEDPTVHPRVQEELGKSQRAAPATASTSRKATFHPENPGSGAESGLPMAIRAPQSGSDLVQAGLRQLPAIVTDAGPRTARRFLEFFTANIRNPNTRAAYGKAVGRFLAWCDARGLELRDVEPVVVAAYVEELMTAFAPPTVKQHLAAIRVMFDWLVTGGCLPWNPAGSVRGPKHVVKRGKTPVLDADQTRELLDSIDTSTVVGLRDRALIGLMVFTFARVGAAVGMRVEDYYQDGKRWTFRLHEKGGKLHTVPAHHTAEEYVDAYLDRAGIRDEKKTPLFRSVDRKKQLTANPLTRVDVFRMIRRRARRAELPDGLCCHTFRATGITAYLDNGGTIENAQAIAAHESPQTTKLYDRTSDELTLDEVERIRI